MRFFMLIMILFAFIQANGADTVLNTNKLKFGQRSSSADKILEFDINAGAANPKIKVNPATSKLVLRLA